MNMKGYNHRYGLERYHSFNAINMGARVPVKNFLPKPEK